MIYLTKFELARARLRHLHPPHLARLRHLHPPHTTKHPRYTTTTASTLVFLPPPLLVSTLVSSTLPSHPPDHHCDYTPTTLSPTFMPLSYLKTNAASHTTHPSYTNITNLPALFRPASFTTAPAAADAGTSSDMHESSHNPTTHHPS